MRMKNPFSNEPGDESGSGAEPEQDRGDESATGDEPAAETRASETRAEESSDSGSSGSNGSADSGEPDSGTDDRGEQELTAPSVGPHTVIEKEPPEERLDFDKISDVDAVGEDKRREVVGKSYGPSKTRVFGTFAAFFLVVGALAAGAYFLAQELDQPPAENPDVAPWSQADAPQSPPKELQ